MQLTVSSVLPPQSRFVNTFLFYLKCQLYILQRFLRNVKTGVTRAAAKDKHNPIFYITKIKVNYRVRSLF